MAQQRLYDAVADVDAKNWEKRNSDVAFQEINQEFESQRFQPASKSMGRSAQTDEVSLYMENWT